MTSYFIPGLPSCDNPGPYSPGWKRINYAIETAARDIRLSSGSAFLLAIMAYYTDSKTGVVNTRRPPRDNGGYIDRIRWAIEAGGYIDRVKRAIETGEDQDMPAPEWHVLLVLAHHADSIGHVSTTANQLARQTCLKVRDIRKAIAVLKDGGLVR